ncbi:unnamed protein product [Aphanomyces euteiches]
MLSLTGCILGPIRALVLRRSCFVFGNLPDDVISQLKAAFVATVGESPSAPFEFSALEAILSTIFTRFALKFDAIQPEAGVLLNTIANLERPRDEFERLRTIQSSLNELKTQGDGLHHLLVSLLDNEEDLALMHLTKLYDEPDLDFHTMDMEYVTTLIEIYLQKIATTLSAIALTTKKADNTESSLNLKWTSKRNQLLMVDIPLKVLFLGAYIGAFVTAIPAMNVVSNLATVDGVFWGLFGCLIVFCAWLYFFAVSHLRKHGVFVGFKAPTPAAPVDSFLTSTLVFDPQPKETLGKRSALQFDSTGGSQSIDVTRHDVLQMTQGAALASGLNNQESTVTRRGSTRRRRSASISARVDVQAVHMRDLRMLDNTLTLANEYTIAVRQQAILVNCGPMQAIILRNKCLIFLPPGGKSLAATLQTQFKSHMSDAKQHESHGFEFTALEAILSTMCFVVAKEQHKISSVGGEQLDLMAKDETNFSVLENLRAVKNAMSELESHVNGLRTMLMTLLDNEEDLHTMHLTKLFKEPQIVQDLFSFDTEETETLLESYLQTIHGARTAVTLMIKSIENTEAIVMLKLDIKRNYLIIIDLIMTLVGTLIAVPNFYVNAFATNLNSHLQEVNGVFWAITASAFVFPAIMYMISMHYFRKEGFSMSWPGAFQDTSQVGHAFHAAVIKAPAAEIPTVWENPIPHPIYTADEVDHIQETHRNPKEMHAKVALFAVRCLRGGFDLVYGYKGPGGGMKPNDWINRCLFLETVAGVPGMVAGMLRHLRSLRTMQRDQGWIHTLLEEAENERMHLLIFMTIKAPGPIFRTMVVGGQGVFFNLFFFTYLISPKTCHRFVGYLEEEAVHTYTAMVEDIEAGQFGNWKTEVAPLIARKYYHLADDATMLDMIKCIRADEANHRDVNHTFANLDWAKDVNPFLHVHRKEVPSTEA